MSSVDELLVVVIFCATLGRAHWRRETGLFGDAVTVIGRGRYWSLSVPLHPESPWLPKAAA